MGKDEFDPNATMPEGTVVVTSKYLGSKWEKKYAEDNGITTDAEKKALHDEYLGLYTVRVEFDFEGITINEMMTQLASTTSFSKMLYNNELKGWTQEEAESCCSELFKCNIRAMLDERKTRSAMSDEEKLQRAMQKQKDKGATKAELLEQIEKMFS